MPIVFPIDVSMLVHTYYKWPTYEVQYSSQEAKKAVLGDVSLNVPFFNKHCKLLQKPRTRKKILPTMEVGRL